MAVHSDLDLHAYIAAFLFDTSFVFRAGLQLHAALQQDYE